MKTVRMPFRSFRAKILLSFFICIIIPIAALLYLFTTSLGEVAWKEMRRGNEDDARLNSGHRESRMQQ